MIDTFSILFSTAMIVLLLVRAVKLDRTLPWFQTLSRTPEAASPDPGRAGRGRPGDGGARHGATAGPGAGSPRPVGGSARGPGGRTARGPAPASGRAGR